MATANVSCICSSNGRLLSQSQSRYELKDDDTVADVVEFYRSTNLWSLNSTISVLQKRSVGTALTYVPVADSFTISPNESYEITIEDVVIDTEANENSTSRDDVATDSSSYSISTINDVTVNLTDSAMSIEAQSSLEAVFNSHEADVNMFYESLNKVTSFKKKNFFNFFNQSLDRVLVFALTSNAMLKNISLLHICRERLRRYLRKIVNMEYPSFDCKKENMIDLYTLLTNWMNSDYLGRHRDEILDVVWNSYLTARYRYRKKNKPSSSDVVVDADANVVAKPRSRKRKSVDSYNVTLQTFDAADHELKQIARSMRESKTVDEVAVLFKQSIEPRYSWIQYILEHPDFEKGAAEAIIDLFPRLLHNVNYLHDDYVYCMKKKKLLVCDLAKKFRQLIPGIFGLALSLNVISEIPDDNRELKAGEVLPSLVKHYIGGPAKRCSKERYIIGSENSINMNEIIRHKDDLEVSAPMIAYIKHRSDLEYYVIVDQKTLKVQGTFADALQSLHELQFVLNLEYDTYVAPLFIFLEYVLGFKSRECNARFRLKHDIESFLSAV